MSTLKNKAQSILDEKELNIIPENIKNGVQIFDITGTYEGSGGGEPIFGLCSRINIELENPSDNMYTYCVGGSRYIEPPLAGGSWGLSNFMLADDQVFGEQYIKLIEFIQMIYLDGNVDPACYPLLYVKLGMDNPISSEIQTPIINEILRVCSTITPEHYSGPEFTLAEAGFTNEQAQIAEMQPNWVLAQEVGWTTGY